MTREELIKKAATCVEASELDELVHDLKSKEASAINNAGVEEQLDYICNEMGEEYLTLIAELIEEEKVE